MTELNQTAAEVTHVDALSAAVVLAAVGQQGNTHSQLFPPDELPRQVARNGTAVNALLNPATTNWTCVQTIIRSANCRNAWTWAPGRHPR